MRLQPPSKKYWNSVQAILQVAFADVLVVPDVLAFAEREETRGAGSVF